MNTAYGSLRESVALTVRLPAGCGTGCTWMKSSRSELTAMRCIGFVCIRSNAVTGAPPGACTAIEKDAGEPTTTGAGIVVTVALY